MKLLDKLLSKKQETLEIEVVEPVDERRQELATVQVRDIKQYLVEEYERSQELYDTNEKLREQLGEIDEIKMKYDAALVTIDQYSKRLEMQEGVIKRRDESIDLLRAQVSEINESLNDYKIKFQRAAITKDEIREELIKEVKNDIVLKIKECKGNLSKIKVIDIILS